MRYRTNSNEFLRYDQALASGWPIATGVVEGACWHLRADRLDIVGSYRLLVGRRGYRVHQARYQDRYDLLA